MKLSIAVMLALACTAGCRASAAECFHSPREVWAQHPGTHPRWHYIDHQICWRSGVPSAHASRDRRSNGMASVPPLPPLRYNRLLPAEGRALARELLP